MRTAPANLNGLLDRCSPKKRRTANRTASGEGGRRVAHGSAPQSAAIRRFHTTVNSQRRTPRSGVRARNDGKTHWS